MSLMKAIREYRVTPKSVALWWLGQNSYIFKTPQQTIAGVDLYLTDSCAGLYPGLDLARRHPVLIQPEELAIDLFTCTHNHQDHTDPETLRRLRHKDRMQFVGPHPSCEVFRREGVEQERIIPAWPDCEIAYADIRIHGAFAVPTDDTDLNHLGFVFEIAGGPNIYVTGDTAHHELLYSAAKHSPDLLITCINGGFNNLSHWEAALLAGKIRPKIAIPCHYDLFADNAADPKQFRSALLVAAPEVKYQELTHGKVFVFSKE